jgi:hypothetical protein
MMKKWQKVLENCGVCDFILDHKLYLSKKIPLAGVAHQCGTLRWK